MSHHTKLALDFSTSCDDFIVQIHTGCINTVLQSATCGKWTFWNRTSCKTWMECVVPTGDRCGSVVLLGVEISLSEYFGGNQSELFPY